MQQSLFTIYEDRRKKLNLTSKQKEEIFAIGEVLGKNRLSLSYDGFLHVRHYVGFVSKGNTRLQILPKIYESTGFENEQREAMHVILNLLRMSEFNHVLELPEQSSSGEQTDIMEFLISIFADKVYKTYSRQMNREYISVIENSTYIKGKIDFATNQRKNPIRKDLHVIAFESFEHDNLINNIVKTACLKLLRLTLDSDNKKRLKKALDLLDNAKELTLTKSLFELVKFTRLNMPFKSVFEMAKMFFYHLTPQSYQGMDTVCSFLVPLNELFEFYLFKLFKSFGRGITVSYQKSRLFANIKNGGSFAFIRPDIILHKDNRLVLIADAKYKNPGYQNGIYANINSSDIYQVFTYAKVYKVQTVALIYPQFEREPVKPVLIEIGDKTEQVHLVIACVNIKDADFTKNCEELKSQLFSENYLIPTSVNVQSSSQVS